MRTLLILACTAAWLHTGDALFLLAWGTVLIRTSPVKRDIPKAPTPDNPPPAKKTPDRHRAAHRAWMKDLQQ